jgi:hypothetical protein
LLRLRVHRLYHSLGVSPAHTACSEREPFAVEMTKFVDELVVGSATEAGQASILGASPVEARRQPRMLERCWPDSRLWPLCAEVRHDRRRSAQFQFALDLADPRNLMGNVNIRDKISKKGRERIEIELRKVTSENGPKHASAFDRRGKLCANRCQFVIATWRATT